MLPAYISFAFGVVSSWTRGINADDPELKGHSRMPHYRPALDHQHIPPQVLIHVLEMSQAQVKSKLPWLASYKIPEMRCILVSESRMATSL
jgi:hypothetical protein